ncbi:Hypothetical_protein [Hexamita inflata]|uniref:Hypothetical_protein n=1 Tax=Hexamita inflata TaxID=28002 RepID=A0AA86NH32_9EUKA|nr:Hypothetical protein HINF_LOCUS7210 [Hexamita inflata]
MVLLVLKQVNMCVIQLAQHSTYEIKLKSQKITTVLQTRFFQWLQLNISQNVVLRTIQIPKLEADALELNLNYWCTSRDTLEIITTFASDNYRRIYYIKRTEQDSYIERETKGTNQNFPPHWKTALNGFIFEPFTF